VTQAIIDSIIHEFERLKIAEAGVVDAVIAMTLSADIKET
jgi:hypothetical protein